MHQLQAFFRKLHLLQSPLSRSLTDRIVLSDTSLELLPLEVILKGEPIYDVNKQTELLMGKD